MSFLSTHSKKLMVDYETTKNLPSINFSDSTSMSDIVQSLKSLTIGKNKDIGTALESFDSTDEDHASSVAIEELNEMASSMSKSINNALEGIRSINASTSSIITSVDKLFRELGAKDPLISKYCGLRDEKIDFMKIDWNLMNNYKSESSIVVGLNVTANINSGDKVDMSLIPYFCNQLPFIKASHTDDLYTINHSDKFEDYVSSLRLEGVGDIAKAVTNEREGRIFMNTILMALKPADGAGSYMSPASMIKYLNYLNAFGTFTDNLTEEITGFGYKEYEHLHENIAKLQCYFDVMAYNLVCMRRTVVDAFYIVEGGYINPDCQEEYNNSGLKDADLINSIKYYKSVLGHLPTGGLTVTRVKDEHDVVESFINDRFTSSKFDAEYRIREIRFNAMTAYLNDEINKAANLNIRGYNESQIRAVLKGDKDLYMTKRKTEDDVIRDTLVMIYEPFTLTERLYKKIKDAYASNLPSTGNVTNTDVKMIETKVVAKAIAEFCKKEFC